MLAHKTGTGSWIIPCWKKAWNPVMKLDYFLVPPVVRKSLLRPGFTEEQLKDLHEKWGGIIGIR
ncbi:MAG: hypothetical protein R2941_19570 [Desulfobacterales bacterium]